jgi:hypothetical protein
MKAIKRVNSRSQNITVILARAFMVAGFLFYGISGLAQLPPGWKGGPTNTPLDSWSFHDSTNWTSDLGYQPVSFTNLNYSRLATATRSWWTPTFPLGCNITFMRAMEPRI